MEGRYYHIDLAELWRMWVGDVPAKDIAAHFGVSVQTIYGLKRKHKLPVRGAVCEPRIVDPTPDEIAERARECRERHFAQRRAETDECARIKAWRTT